MRSPLRAVLLCTCFLALISLHPSIAQHQKEREKKISPLVAQEMHELQTIFLRDGIGFAAIGEIAAELIGP